MNIYDFAGNEWEWTLEYTSNTSSPSSHRGGFYYNIGNSNPASGRNNGLTTNRVDDISFRVALY